MSLEMFTPVEVVATYTDEELEGLFPLFFRIHQETQPFLEDESADIEAIPVVMSVVEASTLATFAAAMYFTECELRGLK